jgi:hypothetical protein
LQRRVVTAARMAAAAVIPAMGGAPRVMAADGHRVLVADTQLRAATGAGDLHTAAADRMVAAEATAAIAKRNSGASLNAI